MSALRAARKALLGETWSIPLGVVLVLLVGGLVLKPLGGSAWTRAGGFALLAGVVLTFLIATRPRR